jgi:hypothetical protein
MYMWRRSYNVYFSATATKADIIKAVRLNRTLTEVAVISGTLLLSFPIAIYS